jgi:hypothetical protein
MVLLPSYIKNTTQLIIELEEHTLPADCVIFAADVESLYPSIDICDGLTLLRRAINRHNHTLIHKFSIDTINFILELAEWVLNNNFIQFGTNNYYKQIKGTAMGTPFAVTFACIYMGELELEALDIMKTLQITLHLYYRRFIDDILAFFRNLHSATQFLLIFNQLRPGLIILKQTHIGNRAEFMDLVAYKGTRFSTHNIIDFNLYQKEFNKYLYLPTSSFHKQNTFISFIQSEMKRYRINCSDDNNYNIAIQCFAERLLARGYTQQLLNNSMNITLNRQQLICNYITRSQEKITNKLNNLQNKTPLIFKTTHTPRQSKLQLNKCLQYDEFIGADLNSAKLFTNKPLISYKRSSNIGDYLTSSKYKFELDSFDEHKS